MPTYTKLPLSASVNGKRILISAVASASANPIHTAVSGTGSLDEIWLYAYNEGTASVVLDILWGGTVEPNDIVRVSMPSRTGRTLVVDGALLQNDLTVGAYAQVANFITIDGFINRIT